MYRLNMYMLTGNRKEAKSIPFSEVVGSLTQRVFMTPNGHGHRITSS